MTGLVEMASVPHMRTSNVLGNRPDRISSDTLGYSGSSWRRDSGERSKTNTDHVVLNGLRVDCDLSSNIQDYNSNKSPETMGEVDGTCTVVDSENIVSVQNNPFFKSFGIKTSHRDSKVEEGSKIAEVGGSVRESDSVFDDAEEEQVYHPGSGFVHKLLDKFSSLSAREERIFHPKRTASLENLIADPTVKHLGLHKSTKDDIVTKPNLYVHMSTGSLSAESQVNHRIRPQKPLRVPVAPFKQSVYDSDQEKKRIRSPRDSFEPADVKLGRQDIVIIESTPVSPRIDNNAPMSPTPDQSGKVVDVNNFKEEKLNQDELPKPNTVINFRSFFESKKSKKAPLPPSPVPVSTVSFVHPLSPTVVEPPPPVKKPLIPARPVLPVPKDPIKPAPSLKLSETMKLVSPRQTEANYSSITSNSPRYNAKTVASVAPYRDETEDNGSTSGLLIFTSKPSVKPKNIPSCKTEFINKSEDSTRTSDVHENKSDVFHKSDSSVYSKTVTTEESQESALVDTKVHEQDDSICKNDTHESEESSSNEPIRGVPTFIANRRKKEAELRLGHQQESVVSSSSRSSPEIVRNIDSLKSYSDSSGVDFPVLNKYTPSPSTSDTTNSISNGTSELDAARKNIENARSKTQSQGVSMVFDSSQLTVKKRPQYASSNNVPRLDLTSITNDVMQNGHYQEGYKPTEIKPCRIEFIGAMVKLERSLLEKNNVKKNNSRFATQVSEIATQF
ncbi:uncharacterized protein LOC121383445 isoform X2 [Gigantopelta aegis]|uniref:uncharacterized protein LOC121383445 isoform X2 n=1 Tax=Gigantopelta aegis TaxID=1735272 RepID=UPI001B88B8F7|nr:uncharacterized protein LOC121383445 isoform X2 [Gigantopelta aegis]